MTRGRIIVGSILFVVALVVAGYFGVRSMIRKQKVAPFKDHVPAYLAAPKGPPGMQQPLPPGERANGVPVNPPSIKGKVITIDAAEREVDYLLFDLPEDLAAKAPEEVGTIVWLKWDKEQVGSYGSGNKPAYKQFVTVTVIDKASGSVVGQNVFQGTDPPSSVSSRSSSASGSKPEKEVVDYLSRLPRS